MASDPEKVTWVSWDEITKALIPLTATAVGVVARWVHKMSMDVKNHEDRITRSEKAHAECDARGQRTEVRLAQSEQARTWHEVLLSRLDQKLDRILERLGE